MENDITSVFDSYLHTYKSVDIAEAEFKKNMHEDPELRRSYRDWCHQVGSSEKNGFFDYAEEFLDQQNNIWETLNDYDDE